MKLKNTCIAVAATGLILSCQKSETTASPEAASAAPSTALTSVIEASAAGDPKAIHTIRKTVEPGDSVTVSGRVMGNASPFVEGRAAFILGDPEVLTACSDIPGDSCKSPWDNCCDSPEDKQRGTATVQIVDGDGRVLKEGIEGVGGIDKLATLTVSGTVAEGSTSDLLVINANAIDVAE